MEKLHGWLKGVNTNTLVEGTDIGLDGQGDTDNPNRWFGRDAAGFSLGYYSGDYQGIGSGGGDFLNADLQYVYSSGSDLFNGNISHMVTAIHQYNTGFDPVPQATTYRYDRLNRIKEMKAYQGTVSSGVWTAQTTETYSSSYKYDFNGNITELERNAGVTQIDDLEYFYNHDNHTAKTGLVSNKLYLVDEQSTHAGGNDLKQGTLTGAGYDRNDDATWNYHYDPIGNLIKDVNDSIDLITWTVTGKVSDVIFASSKDDLSFRYDPMGNRIAKIQKPKNWTDEEEWTITWYARDAQGNVLAVYNKPTNSSTFAATEFNIYGSSRIGMVTQPEALPQKQNDTLRHTQTLGYKVYEFSNHLGNVLTTFSDRKIEVENISDHGNIAFYTAEILSSTDYYPFGFQMPGRVYEADGYRYGFNAMEKDDEIKGSGNSYTTELRLLDVRIGRWLSVDPYNQFSSPYIGMGNNPINGIDPDGGWFDNLNKQKNREKRALHWAANHVPGKYWISEGKLFWVDPLGDEKSLDINRKNFGFFSKRNTFGGIYKSITWEEREFVKANLKAVTGCLDDFLKQTTGTSLYEWSNDIKHQGYIYVAGSVAVGFVGIANLGKGKTKIRVRHYTNRKGLNSISESMIIQADKQGIVYTTSASKKPFSKRDAESLLGIRPGRGRDYIEFDIDANRIQYEKNSKTGFWEYKITEGDVKLDPSTTTFHRRR